MEILEKIMNKLVDGTTTSHKETDCGVSESYVQYLNTVPTSPPKAAEDIAQQSQSMMTLILTAIRYFISAVDTL